MEYVYFLPPIEVLIFNLINLDRCLTRKYSIFKTALVLCCFTALFSLPWILSPGKEFYGKGQLSVLGFLYIVPLKFLYQEKLELLFTNVCMNWSYSLAIMAISVQTAYFLGFPNYDLSLALVEAILLGAAFVPFRKYMIPQFCYILQNTQKVQKKQFAYLKTSIYFQFFMLLVLHVIFLDSKKYILQIAALVMFVVSNYLLYRIVYEVINNSIKVNKLEKEVSKDVLTKLGNRMQLMKDMRSLMQENRTFSIVFLDLDSFKLINDKYGHDIGDRYLIHFGKVVSEELGDKGKLYRYGGDEFIAIYYGVLTEHKVDRIVQCNNWDEGAPCAFNQVSAGFVVCEPPYDAQNPSDIIMSADDIMYQNKQTRKEVKA
ncbi:GGDEF domain-containing protein [uncultured Ruthenibacterium sp.]|uniref:GGDEF domain-containing protein n=1 Tax=uncultured Ruthenibacterium sp. TaxID=1905347 RepID=UPI00349EA310